MLPWLVLTMAVLAALSLLAGWFAARVAHGVARRRGWARGGVIAAVAVTFVVSSMVVFYVVLAVLVVSLG
jgi:hypothetical protein